MRIRIGMLLTVPALTIASMANADTTAAPPRAARLNTINYVLGTQSIGVKYQFTEKTSLVETATRIHEMGSNILKFSMSKRGFSDHYRLPPRDDIRSLVDLASKEPSVKAVLDMPFAYYLIWIYPFSSADDAFKDGLSVKERDDTYEEVHALAKYLLTTYAGTGKTFLLGHWEGDWHLLQGYDPKKKPTASAIQGMIDWLNVRQKAIDDAKREVQAKDVYLNHYTEANLVRKGIEGGKCLVNDVLPHTTVDYVSYSSYDTIGPHRGHVRKALREALDYIESKLPPKPGVTGKRVFIGEYGFPLGNGTTPQKQDAYSRNVCLTALEWGCPFVLYWQMYCNEGPRGKHRGFWLIDENNRKQPFYYTLQGYYAHMKQFVSEYKTKQGHLPNDAEIREQAIAFLKRDTSEPPPAGDAPKAAPEE